MRPTTRDQRACRPRPTDTVLAVEHEQVGARIAEARLMARPVVEDRDIQFDAQSPVLGGNYRERFLRTARRADALDQRENAHCAESILRDSGAAARCAWGMRR